MGRPLRASGGTPAPQPTRIARAMPSPRERRYPAGQGRHVADVAALSARAEVPRRPGTSPVTPRCPLRASGGTPRDRGVGGGLVQPSPRERRYPVYPSSGPPHRAALSARAEVPRSRAASSAPWRRPLRASGGTPRRSRCPGSRWSPSPRERRYPARGHAGERLVRALSARAEVPRRSSGTSARPPRPLRASGGTPSLARMGRAACVPSPRERRYPAIPTVTPRCRVALSARAEVPRWPWRPTSTPRRPLRASGGTPNPDTTR